MVQEIFVIEDEIKIEKELKSKFKGEKDFHLTSIASRRFS